MENTQTKETNIYLCPNCGGNMKYNIKKKMLCCEYCETECEDYKDEEGQIKEYDLEEGLEEGTVGNWKSEAKVMECKSCGAEIVVNSEEKSANCSFCGSSHVIEGNLDAGIKPEAILPFGIDQHQAKENLEKWMKTRFLSPNDLKHMYSSDKLKAIYVPYWTFDAKTNTYYTGQGGKVYYETVTVDGKEVKKRRVTWYSVSGNVNRFFDDIQVNASKNFKELMMNKIEPFNMGKLVPYNQKYLSGYVAERYTKGIKICFGIAKLEMRNQISNDAKRQILNRYDEAKITNLNVNFSDCKFKHILLPVWTAQYDYNGKKYVYVINGESGKVSGSVPYSIPKIVALIIIAIIVIVAIMYMRG